MLLFCNDGNACFTLLWLRDTHTHKVKFSPFFHCELNNYDVKFEPLR